LTWKDDASDLEAFSDGQNVEFRHMGTKFQTTSLKDVLETLAEITEIQKEKIQTEIQKLKIALAR
jgi:hypothetical protein